MRLIDLHNNWLLQYADETSLFDPADAQPIPQRLPRLQGYLTDTAVAFLVSARPTADTEPHPDRWTALDNLLTRYEAEFSGRLLIDPTDLALYRAEPTDSLTWGVLTVGGLDTLIHEPRDLDRLEFIYRRGVRVFQLASSSENRLVALSSRNDLCALTDLGMNCLERIADVANKHPSASRLVIDLSRLNPAAMTTVLDWLAADRARLDRLIPIHTHGLGALLNNPEPSASAWDAVTKLISLGGLIAIDPDGSVFTSPDQLAATLSRLLDLTTDATAAPHRSRGIALSTNFLSLDRVIPGLDNVERLIRWATHSYDTEVAQRLVFQNANRLLERILRVEG